MAIPLRFRKLPRRNPCSVYRCKNRDTYLIHRGQDVNHNTLFLCEECIKDIVGGYIDAVGEERARETLAESVKRLYLPEPSETSNDTETDEPSSKAIDDINDDSVRVPYQTEYKTAKAAAQANKTRGN